MYLLSSSATVLVQEDEKVVAHLQHGTIGFSTPTPADMAIQSSVGRIFGVKESMCLARFPCWLPERFR